MDIQLSKIFWKEMNMMNEKLELRERLDDLLTFGEFEVKQNEFRGWTISSSKWELTIRPTTQQDEEANWPVILAEVNSEVNIESGLSTTEILEAVKKITAHWIEPIVEIS